MKKYSKRIILIFGLLSIGFIGFAQPGGNGNGRGPQGRPPGPPRPAIPIDGGISLLAAAGLAYGARKLYLFQKQEPGEL